MTAKIIDGKAHAQTIWSECRVRVEQLKTHGIVPGLAVLIVGDNPASHVYVRNKVKACHEVGIHSESFAMPDNATEDEILQKIAALNADDNIHGILVQLPLPGHVDAKRVLETISPAKDVDGFHYYNLGALLTGNTIFPPCTPYGVMCMLQHTGVDIEGKHAVVVGRSNIVGKPMAIMLLEKNATITVCTSRTQQLQEHTLRADILVVATGRAEMVTGDMIKPGAVVLDVGINRLEDGRLVGDVEFDSAVEKASFITPVPGGVGPMTIAILLSNTVLSAEKIANA